MSVRAAYIILDIHKCIYELIDKLTTATSPWTRWKAVPEYPMEDILKQFAKPVIYIEKPVKIGLIQHQGGLPCGRYKMKLGAWDDRKTGGPEEIDIIDSAIQNLFDNHQTVHTTQFTVTLDQTYTNTTLITQGIRIEEIDGGREIATVDIKEFRIEHNLYLRA